MNAPILAKWGAIDALFTVGKMFCALYVAINFRKIAFRSFDVLILLFYGIETYSTYINKGMSIGVLISVIEAVVYVFMIKQMIKVNQDKAVKILAFILELIIYLNFVTILLYPDGLYNFGANRDKKYYLVGHQNQIALYALIAITLGVIRDKLNNEEGKISFRSYLLMAVSLASALIVGSSTSIVGIIALIALIIRNKATANMRISMKWGVAVGLLMFFAVVLSEGMGIVDKIIEFVCNLLNRDVTFSGRTRIWNSALLYVFQHPVFGMGLGQGTELLGFSSAHNRYLTLLFVGGGVLLAVWLAIQFVVYKDCDRMKFAPTVQVAMCYFWVSTITTQFETYSAYVFLTIFCVAADYRSRLGSAAPERKISNKRYFRRVKFVLKHRKK